MSDLVAQYVRDYRDSANASRKEITAHSKKTKLKYPDVQSLVVAYQELFDSLLLLTMVQWRAGIKDTKPSMKEVIDTAREACPVYLRLNSEDRRSQPFDFGLACLLSRFFHKMMPVELVSLLTAPADFPDDPTETPLNPLFDTCLVISLLEGEPPSIWNKLIKVAGGKGKSLSLYARTFQCYMKIIEAAAEGEWESAKTHVHEAYTLFELRKTDRMYRNTLISEAGAEYNAVFVDYRLGALIQICFDDVPVIREAFPPPHVWKC